MEIIPGPNIRGSIMVTAIGATAIAEWFLFSWVMHNRLI